MLHLSDDAPRGDGGQQLLGAQPAGHGRRLKPQRRLAPWRMFVARRPGAHLVSSLSRGVVCSMVCAPSLALFACRGQVVVTGVTLCAGVGWLHFYLGVIAFLSLTKA